MVPGIKKLTSQRRGTWGNRQEAQCEKEGDSVLCKLYVTRRERDLALARDVEKGFLVEEAFEMGL